LTCSSCIRRWATPTAWFIATAGVAGLTLPWCIGQLIEHILPAAMPVSLLALAVGTLFALWRVATAANLRSPLGFSRAERPETGASR
jgi:hypothetical protein